jgi:glycosyltransferase involved in cell wall biosynthesis
MIMHRQIVRNPLRLLMLNYEFPPLGGGASSATYHMAIELQKRGHRVDVLTARERGGHAIETIEGVRVFRVPSFRSGVHDAGMLGAASYLLFARRRLAQLMRENRYDLMHYYFGLPTGVLSFYSHAKHGVPYIVSLRGSDVPGYDPNRKLLPSMHQLLESTRRKIWHNASAIVANSESLRQLALASDGGCHIDVIPNGVDTTRFSFERPPRRNGDALQVLCVSRLIARKGLTTLIEAIAELRDCNLEVEIAGSGRMARGLQELITSLRLQGRVRLTGFMSQPELAFRYRNADVFVLPSLSESCAMALLEALSAGLPVIVSNVGGNPEIVRHEENGLLFEPGSSAQLAAALRRLADAPALRARMSESNIRKIRTQHAWNHITGRYEVVYRRAVDPQARQGTEVTN